MYVEEEALFIANHDDIFMFCGGGSGNGKASCIYAMYASCKQRVCNRELLAETENLTERGERHLWYLS